MSRFSVEAGVRPGVGKAVNVAQAVTGSSCPSEDTPRLRVPRNWTRKGDVRPSLVGEARNGGALSTVTHGIITGHVQPDNRKTLSTAQPIDKWEKRTGCGARNAESLDTTRIQPTHSTEQLNSDQHHLRVPGR